VKPNKAHVQPFDAARRDAILLFFAGIGRTTKGSPQRRLLMPKLKPKKSLLKRIRITKSGKVKVPRAGGRHLRSGKPGTMLRSYRKSMYASAGDVRRVKAMLHMPLLSQERARAAEVAETTEK
jgi:large subunit ribosomal protein L35